MGILMKKTYQPPKLVKRERLSKVVACPTPSLCKPI